MEEQQDGWYHGVEPTDIGSLEDVKEVRNVIPATKGVRVKIARAENAINKDNTFRSISLGLKLVNGIDETGKYKGSFINARVCYFADPNAYTKDFFKNKQHLVQLKYLAKATGLDFSKIDGHLIDELTTSPDIKVDITIKKRKAIINNMEEEIVENEARNFKALDPSELV